MKQTKTFLLGSVASAMLVAGPASAEEIRILINQSPWLNGFVAMVEEYEDQTDNTIELDVTPFGGMLEKTRNSVRGDDGRYDIVALNAAGMAEFYAGGFLKPLTEIDAEFALDENVLTFGGSTGWNFDTNGFSADGDLLGVPINGNVQVLYYRTDLYDEAGLTPPETWDDLMANAKALADDNTYGFIPRASRDSILYNFTSYLFSHGGSFFADPSGGDYSVTIASPEGLKALETYIALGNEAGPPNPGAIAQAELIQLMSTGRAAHAIAVVAAYPVLNDPNSSIVAGKVGTALIPAAEGEEHASAAGHWVAAIPKNVTGEKQDAALDFLNWFLSKKQQLFYVQSGGIPVRKDLSDSAGDNPSFAFLPAFSENASVSRMNMPLPQGSQISDAISLFLNQAVIGELTPTEALNKSADEMHRILTEAGYTLAEPSKL
ncbi:extracellular solute-binding protein [Marinibacterium profundimaris]|uniref:Polyols ABC transporter substrate-binding protein n=1 Tax=Marinibacterium profundimaris TaxID=1679460 RepID=A0A225NEZ4_9RHOB|nr:extracellular solute-binding protein [Marinibacterium profundimaris]OWU70981.1 polyols ABC transporter substrate-binding protein [Marinibacterium profundimaris]